MKKLTVMTILLALLLAVGVAVNAATFPAEAGKEVTVEFNLEAPVGAGEYKITYDSSVLTYVESTPALIVEDTATAGTADLGFMSTKAVEKITVTFTVAEGAKGETEVKLVPGEFLSTDEEEVEVAPQTATVKIGAEVEDPGTTEPDPVDPGTEDPGTTPPPAEDEGKDSGNEDNKGGETDQKPADPAEPAKPSTSDDEMDPTGVSIAYVGLIALVVIAGAVVLIKRK